jgi:phosphopantothenoylcysteine decarboxylase/phosphopantothenate--cysteine ligase
MILSGKKILFGITGGIASYKVCGLIRLLVKAGADVKCVITPNAKNFITETTLLTLTRNKVFCEQFENFDWKPDHISLSDEADLFVIAPASANTIGKIANGIANNLLTSLVMAFKKQIIIAPAMNANMWDNLFVQENIKKLESSGFIILHPDKGELACGWEGSGRLVSIDMIFKKIQDFFQRRNFLKGKKILVTAGGTREAIDPVRFIGNRSSGKMGAAVADAAYLMGADTCLISTLNFKKCYEVVHVSSALEMFESIKSKFMDCDALFMAAAVSDFRVKNVSEQKIKKENHDDVIIELVKNPDILKELSLLKKNEQILIGFCAESENLIENAFKKIDDKNLDFIVANDISGTETGFESDFNVVSIIDRDKNIYTTEKMLKSNIGEIIMEKVFKV